MRAMVYETKGKSVVSFVDDDIRGSTTGFDPETNNDITLRNCPNVAGAFFYLPPNMTGKLVLSNCQIYGEMKNIPATITGEVSLENLGLVIGSIADLPASISVLTLRGLNYVTGSLDDMVAQPSEISLGNCPLLTGSLASIAATAVFVSIDGSLGGITGTMADLNSVVIGTIVKNTSLPGVLTPADTLTYLHMENNGMSTSEVDQTLVNLELLGTRNGTLVIEQERTYEGSTHVVTALASRGWHITESNPPEPPAIPTP